MAKVTTEDCKHFLVRCAEDGLFTDTCETREEYEALPTQEQVKSSLVLLATTQFWKRLGKWSPKTYHKSIGFVHEDVSDVWSYYNPPINPDDIACIRQFHNVPPTDDVGLPGHIERHIYEVIEFKDGTLRLGDNFGD